VWENAIHSGRDFAKAIFWGKDFAKSRLILFEIRRGFGFGFRAQEGSGEECARSFFGRGLEIQNNRIEIVSVISFAMWLSKSKGDAPSASASGISAMATRA
jgi:hypothetical protein